MGINDSALSFSGGSGRSFSGKKGFSTAQKKEKKKQESRIHGEHGGRQHGSKGQHREEMGVTVWQFQNPTDLLYSVIKAMAMATMIVLVGCYYGYTATGGPVGPVGYA